MKSVCDRARDTRRDDDLAEVVAPYSTPPAFNKAAHLLRIRIVRSPLRGWFVTRGNERRLIHLGMLPALHVPIVKTYLVDLRAPVADVRAGRTPRDPLRWLTEASTASPTGLDATVAAPSGSKQKHPN